MYHYTMSTVSQGKYPRTKGNYSKKFDLEADLVLPSYGFMYHLTEAFVSVVGLTGSVVAQRSDHGTSAPPMLQAAASAAGAPLVASPYPQSYLQYNTQQYGQQQVIQAMAPYTGQVKSPFLNLSLSLSHCLSQKQTIPEF